MDRPDDGRGRPGGLSRRELLQRLGLTGAALAVAPALMAACGGDDDDNASTGTTAASGGTTGGSAAGGGGGGDAGTRLAEILKIDKTKAGGGQNFTMGAVLALSGNGSFYGKTMSRGIDLGVEHVAAAGGPSIKVEYKDHKSGDAQAGVNAITELGTAGVPAKMASYVDDLGAMLEGTANYKVFTLDGGGGTSIFGQGKPFFWGTRAITPNDAMPGAMEWVKKTSPDVRTVGLLGWDVGEPSNSQIKEDILKKIAAAGFEFNGLYELVAPTTTDFASVLPKIKSNEPNLLFVSLYGQDPGAFANQSLASGIKSQRINFEFTPDGVNASRGAYEQGYTFAYDYFDASSPTSPLAKLFVEEFKNKYGEDPDFYAANFYENTLVMWEVIRRVLAKGGDINSGPALDAALQENLTVVSVYGGTETEVGTYTLDPTTHSVSARNMGVFEYKGGKVTPKAFFGLDAKDFREA